MVYHQKSTDSELRTGCMDQHRMAQQFLYQRYFGRLLGIAVRYTGDRDEATEVLNQAFLKIFNSLSQYQETGSFFNWMAKIVFHTSIDHVRKNIQYRRGLEYVQDADLPVENNIFSQLETEDLFRIVQRLPPATRSVFSLYVLDGYKHREIAEMLHIDEGTSKWHLAHARQELKKMIQPLYQPSK
jgi:RNA polymerase sigma-70 factor (ECF subfamily)